MEKDLGFGKFDLNRKLTQYEMENFDLFMKPINSSKNANTVSLEKSVERTIKELDKYFS